MQIELRCNTMVQDFRRYKEKYELTYGRRLQVVRMSENTLYRFVKHCIKKYNYNELSPEVLIRQVKNGETCIACECVDIVYSPYIPDGYMEAY